ncbi:DUF885 domain-containing protein [Solitalea sp. MAHUQ-68]|uniref:DUF885 domain-containing protein n=1 Tax=Solitalea agri TaxID=2953739 RepID=A0A9X2F278_9SPHI|nr:DUF885 domain-containing protein [Solitalea agri]MCO4292760.1 DUF885 domain-containing protein [Solitalea agri]
MKKSTLFICLSLLSIACKQRPAKEVRTENSNEAFHKMLENYWEDRMKMFPLEATANGDNRYNDQLPNDGSTAFIQQSKAFYSKYNEAVKAFDREKLNDNDKISYDIFSREMNMALEGYNFHSEYLPVNQFWSLTITLPQLGSGSGSQPFATVKDYDNFLGRINGFSVWADTALTNMRTGIAKGYVLPRALVIKVIPQLEAIPTKDVTKSIFYGPINNFPKDFNDADKKRLTEAYTKAINEKINPSYQKLATFFKTEYLPKARTSSGIDAIPQGKELYQYLINYWTTTNKTPQEVYDLGLQQVANIRSEMEKVKAEVGFKGDLKAFFNYANTDKQFMPYKTPKEIIDAFWAIKAKEDPQLKKLFNQVPKMKFEIRQTEAFRAASASPEYIAGTPDGKRPGIFYVPILDATKFNTVGMETLFLHEAIPGHHYQNALQIENTSLPTFRRFAWYGAYGEGWALYAESLGKELGLLSDPYQYLGHLSDAMLRAVRLVVDAGLHTQGWSREKAIQYMTDNMRISEAEATSEVERYMAIPGQALSYKIGQLKIRELRTKYEKQLGSKFNIAEFHHQVLNDGCLPLDVLESKMDSWAAKQ